MRLRERMRFLPDHNRVGAITTSADKVFYCVDTVGLLKNASYDHKFELRGTVEVNADPVSAIEDILDIIIDFAPDLTGLELSLPGPFESLREEDRCASNSAYARFVGVSAGPGWDGVDPYRLVLQHYRGRVLESGGAIQTPNIAVSREVQSGGVGHSFIDRDTVDRVFKRVLPVMYVKLCHQSDISAPYLDGFKTTSWRGASSMLLDPYHHDQEASDRFEGACAKHRRTDKSDYICFDGATSVRAIYKLRKLWGEPCLEIEDISYRCASFHVVAEYTAQMLVKLWDKFGPVRFVLGGRVVTGSGRRHSIEIRDLIRNSFDTQFHESVRNPAFTPKIEDIISLRKHDFPVSLGASLRACRL